MATVTTDGGGGGGGWAAIARKDAPVEKKLDIPSLLSTAGLKTVVVDANAIIGGGIRLSGIADQFFTIKEVLQEVRDPASRFHLATLPVEIRCLEPTEEALSKVVQFARATGDLQVLSEVDMKLIALTYTLEAQVHGTDHIRARPPPLILAPKNNGQRLKDLPGWGNVANPEEWEAIDDDEADGANTGSRIMGLKTLSLDTPDSISTENNGPSGVENEKEMIVDSALVHDSKSNGGASADGENSAPVSSQDETLHNALKGESNQIQSAQGDDSNNVHSERPDTLSAPSKSVEAKVVLNEQADADGDDWQRALSRSTRRQYQKRAERRAAREKFAQSLPAAEGRESETGEPEGIQSAEENADQRSAHGAAFFRPDLRGGVDEAKQEAQLAEGSSDHDGEATELTDDGLNEDEAVLDGSESVDDQSFDDDTVGHTDAASSAVDTEQSWGVGPMWTSSIACMTGDYAMQNVILQMGLRLLSTSGQHIKELNKWILKCQACGKVTNESGRLFCPKCGNGGTLFKVAITVGPNGTVLAGRNRRPVLRGTRYTLPLPKGGREGALKNPILREDQLPAKPRKVKKPEFEAFSSSDVVFSLSHERKGQKDVAIKSAAAVFSGRRNPNERRKIKK